jgi:peptide/histidine transporter 3/4
VGYKYFDGAAGFAAVLFVPLVGWVAEVHFGRYKVTKYSLFVMWLSTMIVYLLRVLGLLRIISYGHWLNVAYSVLILLMLVGLATFQSNIIQLGTDQLCDSSSYEILSYIVLYAWTFSASEVMMQFSQVCFCTEYYVIANLLFPIVLSLALSSDFLFSHWLVKEPVTESPFKVIFGVLRFAAKNRYPRCRSAFIFWDDKRNSRMDLAKSLYGGPFSAQQVEDVKTFFRMLVVVSIQSLLVGVLFHSSNAITKINYDSYNTKDCDNSGSVVYYDCFKQLAIGNTGEMFMTVFLPVYECLLLPILWNYLSRISILKKSGLGLVVLFACLLCLLSITIVEYTKGQNDYGCKLSDNTQYKHYVLVLPSLMAGIGQSVLLISCAEFISAQAPYSMRGTLFGFMCMGVIFSFFSGYVLSTAFSQGIPLEECSLWFLVMCTILSSLLIGVFMVVSYCYKKRERWDSLPSPAVFN